MGRLNSLIKFLVINANGLLALGGLGTVVVAAIMLASDFINLAEVRKVCVVPDNARRLLRTFATFLWHRFVGSGERRHRSCA